MDNHTGGKWLIYVSKHLMDNHLQNLFNALIENKIFIESNKQVGSGVTLHRLGAYPLPD